MIYELDIHTCQTYLTFDFPASLIRELAKLRIIAHDLMIERGQYFRLKLPCDHKLCAECKQIEDEIHFILLCTKFKELRVSLLEGSGMTNLDLRPNTEEVFNIFSRLVYLTSLIETNAICNFILDTLKIR